MNWIKLKQKFPYSEIEIREHFKSSGITDSKRLIEEFLEQKGYNVSFGFISSLKDYENKLIKQYKTEYMSEFLKHVWEGTDSMSMLSWVLSKKHKK